MSTLIQHARNEVHVSGQPLWLTRVMAVALAAVANLVILVAGRVVNGEFPLVNAGDDVQVVSLGQAVAVTLAVGLAAWGGLVVLERIAGNPRRTWTAIALVVALISLLGPIDRGADAQSTVVLVLMHLATAAIIIAVMRPSIATRRVR